MNRRHFLAGSFALAGQQKLLHPIGAVALDASAKTPLQAPHNLLSATFTESFLQSHLVAPGAWHPYPTSSERAAWQAVPDDIREAVIARAEADQKAGWKALLASTFLDYKRNGNRSRYEDEQFGRRAMLQRFVLAECLQGNGRFIDDVVNGVWLICEETFWGVPAHLGAQKAGVGLPDVNEPIIELFGAATAQLLAWTYYLLAPQLDQVSPLVTKRIRIEAERRMLKPARERSDFGWMGLDDKKHETRINNWNPWINSNLIVTNLILEDDATLRLKETARIARSLDAYWNEYWPDAAEEEGPGYYSESVLALFEAIWALDSATGNAANILEFPFLDAMGRFILNAHIVGDDYLAYGDAHRHSAPPGDVLYRFGKAVHDLQLEAFGALYAAKGGWNAQGPGLDHALDENETSMSRALPAVLDADEVRNAPKEDVLIRDAWYPQFGLMTAREKSDSTDGMYVAVLCANNGRSHSHNDTGNFVVYLDGQPVAIDVGVEAYTARTFGPDRYSIWTMQSAYHNLPTVGGVMQHNGVQFAATDRKYESNDRYAMVSFDIAHAYPKEAGIIKWIRTVTLDRVQHRVVIEEDFELERPEAVQLSIMTPRKTVSDKSGVISFAQLAGGGRPATLAFPSPELQPAVETIQLADADLRNTWGAQIYRILLKSPTDLPNSQSVGKGKWTFTFSVA